MVSPQVAPALLVVPLGSTEQHGPHLPLSTDTVIAEELAARAASAVAGVTVAPVLAFGASGEHRGFAGTLSIGTEALRSVIVELGRSADHFSGVVFVNGHGGNHTAVTQAIAVLQSEQRNVHAWWPRVVDGDAHAGRTETSLLMFLRPHQVRTELAEPGDTRPLGQIEARLREGGVASVSANGVLGDPAGASVAHGEQLMHDLVDDLVRLLNNLVEL